jgi:hypothetical protein
MYIEIDFLCTIYIQSEQNGICEDDDYDPSYCSRRCGVTSLTVLSIREVYPITGRENAVTASESSMK